MMIYTDADQRRSGSGDRPTSSRPSRPSSASTTRPAATWTPIASSAGRHQDVSGDPRTPPDDRKSPVPILSSETGPLRASEGADLPRGWAQGHPESGQIRGQRPAGSRMEPGAAGLSGRDEAFGAESSFQALRGHGRGHVGMERGQTPPNSTKSTSRVPGPGRRISLPFGGHPVSTGRPRATKRYGDGVGSDPPSA